MHIFFVTIIIYNIKLIIIIIITKYIKKQKYIKKIPFKDKN